MYPLHDKDLDRLSRNAAEHYEVDSGSSGWEQLEKRLDQELPQKKKRRRFLFWLFFIVVTTGSALIGLLINSQPVRPLASAMPQYRESIDKSEPKQPAIQQNDKAIDTDVPAPGTLTTTTTTFSTVTKKSLSLNKQRSKKKNTVTRWNDDDVFDEPITQNTTSNNSVAPAPSPDSTTTKKTNPSKKPISTDSTAAAKKPPTPHRYIQPLEIGLVAGPDASMASFGPLYKAGYNAGISIGYRFNKRWSVNTGVIYTRKFYQADSNTFHAPKGSYMSQVLLDDVKGNCSMFDIPLNIRYDIAFNNKRRFFASAGASTYLMKNQSYNYGYRYTPTGTDYNRSLDYPEDENYIFSVLNLSVGYEKTISKHVSIQAEPYLKVPLKGMGYGAMKMGSYGMFFSLKYRPTFKARQK